MAIEGQTGTTDNKNPWLNIKGAASAPKKNNEMMLQTLKKTFLRSLVIITLRCNHLIIKE
jgi:hypothetical protein